MNNRKSSVYGIIALMAFIAFAWASCQGKSDRNEQRDKEEITQKADSTRQDSAWLLIPGRSAGKISIGEADSIVFASLGKPDAGDAAMGKSLSTWYGQYRGERNQLNIFASRNMGGDDETSRVQQIRVTSPAFATEEGLHVGANLEEVMQVYPQAQKLNTFERKGIPYVTYGTDQGIGFELNADLICKAIIIHDPKLETGATYIPFQSLED
ncbi:hypothetical protein [Olivibacter sitiensis]|uniref:hypothetical protein n=1 Tax=Olivibacter sitiensis TaxID=376470 RepID=UPI000406D1C1|nr:hypothetical protein [Olivibacter sitiensis]